MRLFREVSLAASTFLVVGNIIGVGIFTTSGFIVEQIGASPWVLGVWIVGGVLALLGAICYSVLAAHIPKAGGEYAFLYPSMGPLPAFLSGWASLLIGFSAPIAAAALGLSSYLGPFLPEDWAGPNSAKGIAIAGLIAVSLFVSLGLRFGARMHSWLTFLNLALIVGFSVTVLAQPETGTNLSQISGSWLQVDFSAVGSAIILVGFGYSGWNAAAYMAEEIRSPRLNIPMALIIGTVAVMAAYLLINLAFFGAVPLAELSGQIPVAEIAASKALGRGGSAFVNVLILSSILSSLTAMSIAGPRVYFAMSRDRLFPGWLSHIDQRRKLPLKAIWFQTAIAVCLILIASFQDILLWSGAILIFFTSLTVLVTFRIPPPPRWGLWGKLLYRVFPGIFVGVNTLVLINAVFSLPKQAFAGALTVAAGIPVYLFYDRRKKLLASPLSAEEPVPAPSSAQSEQP